VQQAQRAQTRQAQQEARAAISLKAQQTLDCLIDQWFVPGALGGSNIVPTLISLLGGGRSRPGVLVPSVFATSRATQQQNRDDIAVDPAVRARDLVLHGRPRSGAGRWLPPTTRTWPHRDRRSVRAPAAQVLFDRRCASSARTRTTRTTATQKGSPLSTSPASTASKHPK
jgi:hypothetical protein